MRNLLVLHLIPEMEFQTAQDSKHLLSLTATPNIILRDDSRHIARREKDKEQVEQIYFYQDLEM